MNDCPHFAPGYKSITQSGYKLMEAYKSKCCWCEIERLHTALDRANKMLYSQGAALGSQHYYAIRDILTDALQPDAA